MKKATDLFSINNKLGPKNGRILFSDPLSNDGYFGRSVVLITEYGENGTVGFILNKPAKLSLGDVIESFENIDIPLFIGGPVALDTLHFVHSMGDLIPNTVKIGDNLYWGGDFNVIPDLLDSGKIDKHSFRFFVGYSGWESGQLEQELINNYWVISDLPSAKWININVEELWKYIVSISGDKYKFWLNIPENIISN